MRTPLLRSLHVVVGVLLLGGCGDDTLKGGLDSVDTAGADLDAPGEATPDTTPADTTPADTTPADTIAPDTTPADTTPADTTPADTTPADTTVADTSTPDTADTTVADTADTFAPDTAAGDVDLGPTCPPSLCSAAVPSLGATSEWRHPIATGFVTLQGDARHRGRDLYLRESDAQWALAKFAYGPFDDDLVDEDVDIYVLRDCAGTTASSWELLGTATTTNDGDHATVEGIEDSGGWVYYEIPKAKLLGPGRHRLLFVVKGDHSFAEQIIEVLPTSARFVVTDVDGTQTETETAEFTAVFLGTDPAAQPHGAEALAAFADRGYHIFYLTARPEWLTTRTHQWLHDHGYPPGEVHTTMTFTGSFGGAAETFKTDEMNALLARFPGGIVYGIGNTSSDEAAYDNVGIPSDRAYLYQFDPASSGTRIDDYATLVAVANAAANVCE